MTIDVVVRSATAGDVVDFRTVSEGFDPGMIDLPDRLFRDRFAGLVDRADYCLLLAIMDDRPVGYALAQDYGPNLRLRFTIGRLHDLYVAEEVRRRGIGRQLMDGVFGWARSRPEPMILHWQASRDAIAFYESLGLEADRVGDYPRYPGFSLDLRESS